MLECSFFLAVDELANHPLHEIGATLVKHQRKVVGHVEIAELASLKKFPNGVYLFYQPQGELMYVGKSSSRSFIERVPAHFDPRQEAWMNSLCKHLMKFNSCAYEEALADALTLEILLVGTPGEQASRVESVFRAVLSPKLNNTRKVHDLDATLRTAAQILPTVS